VFELALTAQRDAAVGDGAAQWLLGSLYLFGWGVPKDHDTGVKWMEKATRTVMPAMPQNSSEMEFFSIMYNTAQEVLPELVRQYGIAWGVALFGQQTRTILQALSSDCLDKSSR
jgi:TPR repeat protein